jgi:hypothetical protein
LLSMTWISVREPRRQLKESGAVVVRKFLTAAETAELQSVARAIYVVMDELGTFADADLEHHFRRWNGVWLERLPDVLGGCDRDLAARYRRVIALIERRTRRVFGDAWRLLALRSFLRRLTGANGNLRWHIDADAAQTNRSDCINVWLPLDAVGADRPSVDVILGSHLKMRELPLLSGDVRERDDAFAASIGPATESSLDPGDALVFDHFTLHRTQRPRVESFSRTSCELRFDLSDRNWRTDVREHLKRAAAVLYLRYVVVRRGFGGDGNGGMARR